MDLSEASYLSDQAFKHRLPVVVYLVAVGVAGFLGNTLVILVYWLRFPPSATRVFVLAMALCDLTTNTIALPLQIITIRYAYDTEDDSFCKVMFAFATFATQASGFILVTVALDRFSRVWRPHGRHLSTRWAIVVNCAVVFAAVVVFAPFVPMYGIHSIDSNGSHSVDPREIRAKMCWVADENVGSLYPFAYSIIVSVFFLCGLLVVTLSYGAIGAKLWGQTFKQRAPTRRRDEESRTPVAIVTCSTSVMYTMPCSTDVSHLQLAHYLTASSTSVDVPRTTSGISYPSLGISPGKDCDFTDPPALKDCDFTDPSALGQLTDGTIVPDRLDEHKTPSIISFARKVISSNKMDTPLEVNVLDNFGAGVMSLNQSEAESARGGKGLAKADGESTLTESKSRTGENPAIKNTPSELLKVSVALFDSEDRTEAMSMSMSKSAARAPDQPSSVRDPGKGPVKEARKGPPQRPQRPLRPQRPQRPKTMVSVYHRHIQSRTTGMMCVLALCYVINWLPHLVAR